jgi:hypothetical protein
VRQEQQDLRVLLVQQVLRGQSVQREPEDP